MKIRTALCFILLLTIMFVSACNMPQSEVVGAVEQTGGIQTWIDAPLDGSTITPDPYEIVLHAFDPAGVTQVELSANGNLLANLPNPDSGKQLATLKYSWKPAAPGNYTLRARAQSAGGGWGSETTAVVTVSDITVTPVNTSTATVTPTLAVTLTPVGTSTPTGTATATVTSTAAALSFTPRISSNIFYYGSCGSDQVTIQVLVPGNNVAGVVLFKNLQDQAGGGATGWDSGTSMNPAEGGWFSRTISSRSVAGANRFNKASLLYQFVVTDRANKVVGRSQVYSDITLVNCGETQPPAEEPPATIITITPTTAPRFVRPPIIFVRPTATLIPPPR
jgi:hypothetical protein